MKIFCPTCENETDGAIVGVNADDGYIVETYKCDTCRQRFERIYPPDLPPNTYMLFCQGCARVTYYTLPEGIASLEGTVLCECGKVTEHDTAKLKPVSRNENKPPVAG